MDATAKAHIGIQKLLQAEQDAAEIVAKAKQDKVARLKQAKAEADEEIAAYKAPRTPRVSALLEPRQGPPPPPTPRRRSGRRSSRSSPRTSSATAARRPPPLSPLSPCCLRPSPPACRSALQDDPVRHRGGAAADLPAGRGQQGHHDEHAAAIRDRGERLSRTWPAGCLSAPPTALLFKARGAGAECGGDSTGLPRRARSTPRRVLAASAAGARVYVIVFGLESF